MALNQCELNSFSILGSHEAQAEADRQVALSLQLEEQHRAAATARAPQGANAEQQSDAELAWRLQQEENASPARERRQAAPLSAPSAVRRPDIITDRQHRESKCAIS